MDTGNLRNAADELAGKAKQAVGDVTGNEELEAEGAVQEQNADAKQDLENAAENVKDTELQKKALDD